MILKILGLFVALLVGAVIIVPRILHVERLWRSEGSVEGITTAAFFGAAGIAAFVGLSPIVGAFSVGMAVASTRVIKQIGEYVSKLEIIFAPLFFAIIGAQVDLRGININVLYLAGLIVAIAIITKLVGCGIPSMIFLKDRSKAMKVGIRKDIPRPVWFAHEGNSLYLLPNYGSDTNWYKNLVVNPTLKISVNGVEIPARGELITDSNRVDDIMGKFKSKYGEVKQYYPKVNVAVEVPL